MTDDRKLTEDEYIQTQDQIFLLGALVRELPLQAFIAQAERAALSALCDGYPDALTKDQCASTAGYEANGGGFNNALSRLRTLELISGRGELRASAELFD